MTEGRRMTIEIISWSISTKVWDRDRTRDPWICSQARIFCQTLCGLRYTALWYNGVYIYYTPIMIHFLNCLFYSNLIQKIGSVNWGLRQFFWVIQHKFWLGNKKKLFSILYFYLAAWLSAGLTSLIWLHRYPGWSETLLGVYVILVDFVMSCTDSSLIILQVESFNCAWRFHALKQADPNNQLAVKRAGTQPRGHHANLTG